MYTTSAIFVLMSVAVYTNAAVAIYPAREKPSEFANQEGCYLEHLQKVIPYGDFYPKNSCSKYTCYTSNMVQLVTCGVQVIDKRSPCELITDEGRDYPGCCPWVMCHTIPPEYLTSESSSERTTNVPVVEHLTTSERTKANTTESPLLDYSTNKNEATTESASEEKTAGPVVEHQTTSKTEVRGTYDTPTQSNERSINDETVNELLIAQASNQM